VKLCHINHSGLVFLSHTSTFKMMLDISVFILCAINLVILSTLYGIVVYYCLSLCCISLLICFMVILQQKFSM